MQLVATLLYIVYQECDEQSIPEGEDTENEELATRRAV